MQLFWNVLSENTKNNVVICLQTSESFPAVHLYQQNEPSSLQVAQPTPQSPEIPSWYEVRMHSYTKKYTIYEFLYKISLARVVNFHQRIIVT